jgi:dTDP-glucose pyrophosphorylase
VSRDLLAFVAEVTPAEKRPLLDDLFASVTLFDNQAVSAVSRARPDGRYEVTLTSKARKLRADGHGVETEVPLDDWIDVGIFGETSTSTGTRTEKVLYLEKRHVTGPDVTITTIVDGHPVRAGIDPYNILIDRRPSDNVRAVVRH